MLKQLIIELGANLPIEELVAALNATTIEIVSDRVLNWADVALAVGPDSADALRKALAGNGLTWVIYQLGGAGLHVGNAQVQEALRKFASANVPGCAELAAIGVHSISPFVSAGGSGLVTIEDVKVALVEVKLDEQKRDLMRSGAEAWNAFVDAVESWNGSGESPKLGM